MDGSVEIKTMKEIQNIIPVTIINDRLGGLYSSARYLAFNLEPWDVPEEVSEVQSCVEFWSNEAQYYVIGKGETPAEAYENLCSQQDKLKIIKELSCDEFGNNPLPFCEVLEMVEDLGGYENIKLIFEKSEQLSELTFEGARRTFGESLPEEIKNRLLYELDIIKKTGHAERFLIVSKILNYARKELGVMAEVIHDAVAGSLVAYCMGITRVDPLKHDLLFERYMRLGEYDPPYFCIDCDEEGLEALKDWVDGKYGKSDKLNNIDISSYRTISIINNVCKIIRESSHSSVDLDLISDNDPDTFEMLQNGDTAGVPMFDSEQMQKYLKKLKLTCLDDLVILNAMRSLNEDCKIQQFIARRNGRQAIKYEIPCMDKYLAESYGILVYQEEIALLSRLLADFTRKQSYSLVEALKYKKRFELNMYKIQFVANGRQNGHDPTILNQIWRHWEKVGDKVSIKSQVVSCTIFAYRVAYLKAHYPDEFNAVSLKNLSYF